MFLYQKIAKELEGRISTMKRPDGRLPSEAQLCAEYNVSRVTIRKSLTLLKDRGIICSFGGKGTFLGNKSDKASKIITIVLGNNLTSLAREQIYSISKNLLYHGYGVTLSDEETAVSSNGKKNFETMHGLYDPSGYVLVSLSPQTQRWFSLRKLPIMVIGDPLSETMTSYVRVRSFPIFYNSVYHLYEQGHKDIVVFFRSNRSKGNMELLKGFHQACMELNISQPPQNIVHIEDKRSSLQKILDDLLAREKKPTAIILHDQESAVPVLTHLQHRKIKIPQELAVVVGTGDKLCDQFKVRLTHSDFGKVDIAEITAQSIMSLVEGRTKKIQKTINPKLIVRESSKYKRR